jgi:hypothetical protein
MKLPSNSPTYFLVSTDAAGSLIGVIGSATLYAAPCTTLPLVVSTVSHNTGYMLTMKGIVPFIG